MTTRLISRRMLVGSEEQLAALGELTLNFGAVDEVVAEYILMLSSIIIGANFEGMEHRLQRLEFYKKVRTLRIMARALAERFSVDAQEVVRLLTRVSEMADHRNDIVHGWIVWDSRKHQPAFRNKNKALRSAEAQDVARLSRGLATWLGEVNQAIFTFIDGIARNAATSATSKE